ncbi:MAG: accessory Sec system protein Asp3 [Lachnospiraceae bacterium]
MRTYQNQCIFIIRWDGGAKDSYLYGTELDWDRLRPIQFANRFLPSGQAIRTWSSAWNFQQDRMEAQLPVLEEGKTYLLRTFLRSEPEGTAFLRLRFFDRYGEQRSFFVSEHRTDRFVCPTGTFSWKMELLWAGASSLKFDHIEVEEAPEEEPLPCPDEERGKTTLVLVIPEGGSRMIRLPALPDPVPGLRAAFLPTAFLVPDAVSTGEDSLEELTGGYQKVVIATYGEKTKSAGARIAALIPGAEHRAFDGIGRMQDFLSGRLT